MHQRCFVANGAVYQRYYVEVSANGADAVSTKCTKGAMFKCLLMCYVALSANGDIALTVNDAMLLC